MIEDIPLVIAMMATIPVSKYINSNKYVQVSLLSIVSGLVGILIVFPVKPDSVNTAKVFDLRLFMGVFFVGVSYIIMLQTTKAWTKKLHPKESRGQYEGLYAISFALIPMIFGSNIGEAIVKITGENMFNELTGRYEYIPNGNIFLIGALISALSIIPILITKKYSHKEVSDC
jgi:MFS family permease